MARRATGPLASAGVRGIVATVLGVPAVLAVVAAGCAGTSGVQVDVRAETTEVRRTTTTRPPDCAEILPVEAQAAQLLMTMVTTPSAAAEALGAGVIGGFGLRGNQTSDVAEQIAAAVEDAPLPAMVAADEEGGTVQRLRLAAGTVPAAATLGEGTPEEAAEELGDHATEVAGLGVRMVFAPVADVGDGAGLGTRSFGDDPGEVADFVEAVTAAQLDGGVIPVVKHWPGIGGGSVDPHVALTRVAPIDELRSSDMVPFDRAIAAGAPAIMVAHAEVPGLTAAKEPASLSREAITGELRGRQGFDGLVITDALGMGAIVPARTQPDAALAAITAGADVALLSGTDVVEDAHAALVEAIESGELPEEQVVASVRRVLHAKGIRGDCLDAVARYSALARAASTTTIPGQVGAGSTGSTSSSSSTTVTTTTSTTAAGRGR